ncbi:MAG: hypothetical protein GKS00_16370 [Alphaproteobacteria bacterium]|nr:hypothetical protein [Alphaproteobacteria bacterium]
MRYFYRFSDWLVENFESGVFVVAASKVARKAFRCTSDVASRSYQTVPFKQEAGSANEQLPVQKIGLDEGSAQDKKRLWWQGRPDLYGLVSNFCYFFVLTT